MSLFDLMVDKDKEKQSLEARGLRSLALKNDENWRSVYFLRTFREKATFKQKLPCHVEIAVDSRHRLGGGY